LAPPNAPPHRKKNMSKNFASKQITVAITCTFIFLMWIAIGTQIHHEEAQVTAAQKNYLHNVAAGLREHVQASFRSTDDALRLLKFHYESTGLNDLPAINRYFRSKVIDISTLNQVGVIDEHGIYAFSNLDHHKKMDLSDREHFKVHKEGGYPSPIFISKPVLGRASGKWSFQITRKLEKPDGSFNGVAVASFNPVQFLEQFQRAGLNSTSLIGLVGMDGYARALRVGDNNRADDTLRDLQLPIEVGTSDAGNFVSSHFFDKQERLYVFEKVENQPLFVVVGINTETALRDFYYQRNVLLGCGLLFTLFALGLTFQRLRSMENCKQLQIEIANLRQAQGLMQSAYEDCLNKTNDLVSLAEAGTVAIKQSASIRIHLEKSDKDLVALEEFFDLLETILQESLRVDLGQISPDEFLFFVKKLGSDVNLDKLRELLVETSQTFHDVFKLLDDVENTQK